MALATREPASRFYFLGEVLGAKFLAKKHSILHFLLDWLVAEIDLRMSHNPTYV